jgi:hypothetical protein
MLKKVFRRSRHIRWNWEQSQDNRELIRYHIVVVDDKNRGGVMNKFLDQIQKVSSGLEKIREYGGKVADSNLRYLFGSYDTVVAPKEIDWTKISKSIKKDGDLRERVRGNIEDYVANLYER